MNMLINAINWTESIKYTVMIVFMSMISIMIFSMLIALNFQHLHKKYNKKALKFCEVVFWGIATIALVLTLLLLFGTIFIFVMLILYFVIYGVFSLVPFNELATAYLSLSTLLIVTSYLPEVITGVTNQIFNIIKAPNGFSKGFCNFVNKLNLKLWIYFAAFVFVVLSSLQDLTGQIFIWKEIKPVIVSSVLTFIAFDRFIKLFKDETKGLFIKVKEALVHIGPIFKKKLQKNNLGLSEE